MKVFYRISPSKATNRPFADGDKGELVRVCLRSFVHSIVAAKVEATITFLLDGCPGQWTKMIKDALAPWLIRYEIVDLPGIGNKSSFLRQLEMALDGPPDEFVYFAEDDYLYRANAVSQMFQLNEIDDSFVTPYDHPDRYTRDDDRRYGQEWIRVVRDWHWRTAESTTMTFGACRSVISDTADIMEARGCSGREMWYPIIDRGYELWGPIPSLATHVQNDCLAPCVDWEAIWKQACG